MATQTLTMATTSPRETGKLNASSRAKTERPLDFSFMNLLTMQDMLNEEARGAKPRKPDEKYKSKSVKLNNNHIQEISGFVDIISQVVVDPMAFTWIDLSFNDLPKIDPALCSFPNLQILYLHGNAISDIKEADKLSAVKTLKKLALHGNPIENIKQYRWTVLAQLPQLNSFDMSTVTKTDRETAATVLRSAQAATAGRKPKKTEDD